MANTLNAKKHQFSIWPVWLLIVITFTACTKDDGDGNGEVDAAKLKETMAAGQWRISQYFDDTDDTADYTGYIFTFNQSGVLSATNGSTALSGSWSVSDADSDDDSSDGTVDFNIFFSSPDIFAELADNWDIVKLSATKLELKDVSGGDGSIDLLTFDKL